MSVRNCPSTDPGLWSDGEYYRVVKRGPHQYLRFTHTLCHCPPDEEDRAYESSLRMDVIHLHSYQKRHQRCYAALGRLKQNWCRMEDGEVYPSPIFKASNVGLPVALLRVCRTIYEEAALIPYASNTFAFHEGHTLDLFISQSLSVTQREAIQSLQLEGGLMMNGHSASIQEGTISMLTGLRSLNVCLELCAGADKLKEFAQLKLRSIKVLVTREGGESHVKEVLRQEAQKLEDDFHVKRQCHVLAECVS